MGAHRSIASPHAARAPGRARLRTSPCALPASLTVSLGVAFTFACVPAQALQPMADEALSSVHGQDGLAFNLSGFSLSGPLTLTYTSPDGSSLSLGNISLSRSDDANSTFSDPYTLKVLSRGNGLADVIQLNEPANTNGLLKWQLAADLSVTANGSTFGAGTLQVNDLISRGGSVTLTTPSTPNTDGFAFGIGLRLDVGSIKLLPRGASDTSEQFALTGIHLGAADASGNLLGAPWMLADATNQPGILNAQTDPNTGVSYLHVGIGWPTTAAGAPIASLQIDNVSFASAAVPGGQMDLGASRIGTMQIQYLDVRLRAGQ
jgi:hypothetical protein